MTHEIIHVTATPLAPANTPSDPPAIIVNSGKAAYYAYAQDFVASIENLNTLKAYQRAADRFLEWCDDMGLELQQVMPAHVRSYISHLTSNRTDHEGNPKKASKPMRLLHLSAIRQLFDHLVTRHAVLINPAASVKGPKHTVRRGKTPAMAPKQAESVLWGIDGSDVVSLRDRAIVGALIWSARRASAVANLKIGDYFTDGTQWYPRFEDKGGDLFDVPVRTELQNSLHDYIETAGIAGDPPDAPLFRTAKGKTKALTRNPITGKDLYYVAKRRFQDAGLPPMFTTHSFRATTATDLLEQGVPLDDVQQFLGHRDPRTTKIYDHRDRKITRNIVERISIKGG
jgi:site-specific recombinase XerD